MQIQPSLSQLNLTSSECHHRPKHFSFHSRYAKTRFLQSPLCQNTFLAITATPKHFSYYSRNSKTLSLLFPQQQNAFLAIPATPKHYTFSHLATPGHNLATPGHNLATHDHHLTTAGYTWQQLATPNRQHAGLHYILLSCATYKI